MIIPSLTQFMAHIYAFDMHMCQQYTLILTWELIQAELKVKVYYR